MQREFASRSATTANHLKILGNSISAISINIGRLLLPAVNALLAPIVSLSNWVGDVATQFPTLTTVIAGLTVGAIGLSVATSVAAFAGSFLLGGYLKLANVVTFLAARKLLLAKIFPDYPE